jgi:hypothetical protein
MKLVLSLALISLATASTAYSDSPRSSRADVEMRSDGSYYDPSVGRRVAGGSESVSVLPDDRAGV